MYTQRPQRAPFPTIVRPPFTAATQTGREGAAPRCKPPRRRRRAARPQSGCRPSCPAAASRGSARGQAAPSARAQGCTGGCAAPTRPTEAGAAGANLLPRAQSHGRLRSLLRLLQLPIGRAQGVLSARCRWRAGCEERRPGGGGPPCPTPPPPPLRRHWRRCCHHAPRSDDTCLTLLISSTMDWRARTSTCEVSRDCAARAAPSLLRDGA